MSSKKPNSSDENFIISVAPEDITARKSHAANMASKAIHKIIESGDSNMKSVRNYIHDICSMNGISVTLEIKKQPPPIYSISEALKKSEYQLYPISDNICLIDSLYYEEGSIDGALITENGSTSLIAAPKMAENLYFVIMTTSWK